MKCIKKSFFLIPFQRFNRLHNLKNDYVQSPKAAVMYLNLNTISKSYCKYFFSRFRYNLFTGSYFSVRLSRSKIYCSEMTGTDRDKCNVTSTYTLHILFLSFVFFFQFSTTAWVGSVSVGVMYLFGPITSGLSERFGCKVVAFLGGFLCILGLLLTSYATDLPKLYVTYGILWGIGSSFCYFPTLTAPGEYFCHRLSLVNGIVTAG